MVEDGDLGILGTSHSLVAAGLHTQIDLGQTREGVDTGLEVGFLALDHKVEIGSQRHVAESRHEDSLGFVIRIGAHVVGTLAEESKHTTLKQHFLHLLRTHLGRILLAEVLADLLGVSGYLNT